MKYVRQLLIILFVSFFGELLKYSYHYPYRRVFMAWYFFSLHWN